MSDHSRISDRLKDEANHQGVLSRTRHPSFQGGPQPPFSLKTDRLVLLLLSMLVIASWLPRMSGPIDLRWDGGAYYVLGTSLAEGKGYRLLNEPGEIEAIQYPPLLASFVAAHQIVLGTSDLVVVGRWLRLSFFFIYAALAFATYVMLRHYFAVWVALFGTLVVLLNLFTTFLSDLCFAEIPFALAIVLFVVCTRKSSGPIHGAFAGVFATVAFLLRSVGVALFAAWVIEGLVKKEFRKAAVRLLIASVPVLAWQAYILHVEHSPSYTKPAYAYQRAGYMFYNVSYATNISLADPFRPELGKVAVAQLATRISQNLLHMPVSLGGAVSAKKDFWRGWMVFRGQRFPILKMIPRWLFYVPLILLGGLILGGVTLLAREREVVVPVCILATLGAISLTPWPDQFNRYLASVAPILVLALLSCLLTLWRYCRTVSRESVKWSLRIFIALVAGLILTSESYSQHVMYRDSYQRVKYRDRAGHEVDYRSFYYGKGYKALDAGLDWLKRRAKPDDIIAASMPQWAYLKTGLKAVMPPFEEDLKTAQSCLDSVPVTYLVLDFETGVNFAIDYMMPLALNAPQYWKQIYSDEEGTLLIYERVRVLNPEKAK